MSASFIWIDWTLVGGYLALTTWFGARLAGRSATIRDFFLAGRKLPWWAICGSIIATEISAATLVGVPTLSFAAGGDFTYLQLALGSILARVLVGLYFVPRYYEEEIYSPYEYVGHRLGPRVKQATTGLFLVGAVLGQGARLYITSFVLSVVAGTSLTTSIWLIGLFAVGWTLLGGMTTVIWTDVIQFGVMFVGALAAVALAVGEVPGGWTEVVRLGGEAGKFRLINLSTDLSVEYTLWCGLLATPFLNLAAFGTDQVMAQRMFCCRDERDARKAIVWSSVSLVITVVMLWVGVALYAYFRHNAFTPAEAERFRQDPRNYLLPIFIVRALPVGLRALLVAAIFAAAISTLDGALTALAQVSLEPCKKWTRRLRGSAPEGETMSAAEVALSKAATIVWGVLLCLMAIACIRLAANYKNVIDLALGLAGYTYGPLLGIFLLAFLRTNRDDAGLVFAVPLSVLAVYGMAQHGLIVELPGRRVDAASVIVWTGAGLAAAAGAWRYRRDVRRAAAVFACAAAVVLLHHLEVGTDAAGAPRYPAFTWTYPLGALMTFGLAYALGNRRAPVSTAAGRERAAAE